MVKYDDLIIGFGKGGKTLAVRLAEAGRRVALAEQSSAMYGGTCINVGCIPSKSFVNSSSLSAAKGGTFEELSQRYSQAVEEKDKLTDALRRKNYDKLNDNPNVDVYTGKASFIDNMTVKIEMEAVTETVVAEHIFINTGSRPFVPPIPGLKDSKFACLSEGLLSQKDLPRRLVIIGGGYIGVEFASMYANFGSQVTVIQDGPVFLPREDADIADTVLASLNKRGIRVMLKTKTESVKDEDGYACLTLSTAEGRAVIEAETVLIATGRRPNVEELNLGAAGVELTARGAIKADEKLKTTAENIWGMGDVTGGLQFTYISLDDYRIVASQLLGEGPRSISNRGEVPYSVFLDPPFSRVGLSEKEAQDQGYDIKTATLKAAAIPKANVIQKTDGLLKAIIDAKTGLILGAHLFCAESHELINTVKLAMDAKLQYTVLRDNIYTHPTMSEALNDLFGSL